MAKKNLSKKQIKEMVQKVSAKARDDMMPISQAFVFGSYANSKRAKKNDLDLCFISPKFKNTIKAEAYLRTKIHLLGLDYDWPIDIVAYRPEEFSDSIPLVAEIKRTGERIL